MCSAHTIICLGVNYIVIGIEIKIYRIGISVLFLKGIGIGENVIGIFNNFFNYFM